MEQGEGIISLSRKEEIKAMENTTPKTCELTPKLKPPEKRFIGPPKEKHAVHELLNLFKRTFTKTLSAKVIMPKSEIFEAKGPQSTRAISAKLGEEQVEERIKIHVNEPGEIPIKICFTYNKVKSSAAACAVNIKRTLNLYTNSSEKLEKAIEDQSNKYYNIKHLGTNAGRTLKILNLSKSAEMEEEKQTKKEDIENVIAIAKNLENDINYSKEQIGDIENCENMEKLDAAFISKLVDLCKKYEKKKLFLGENSDQY